MKISVKQDTRVQFSRRGPLGRRLELAQRGANARVAGGGAHRCARPHRPSRMRAILQRAVWRLRLLCFMGMANQSRGWGVPPLFCSAQPPPAHSQEPGSCCLHPSRQSTEGILTQGHTLGQGLWSTFPDYHWGSSWLVHDAAGDAPGLADCGVGALEQTGFGEQVSGVG
jgi:hypothetical protein